MKFTYEEYELMLTLLKKNNYKFCKYGKYIENKKVVILRHDIDMDLDKALKLARVEFSNNVKSTYFVLLSTEFYNVFSKKGCSILYEIMSYGHDIGLHFDEVKYNCKTVEEVKKMIYKEVDVLEKCINRKVESVSMHRPSKLVLENNIVLDDIINSYSKEYFENFKYISDSRMYWRENINKIICGNEFSHLHILTHAFWYNVEEYSISNVLIKYIENQKRNVYNNMNENIRNLDELLNISEIIKGDM